MTPGDPGKLKSNYLQYFDAALDMLLAQGLAVIVDIHPSDEFKARLKDDRQVENFAKFWRALGEHLSKRDPEKVFLETINEPMVEDAYRWYGIQAKLIAAIRAGAPQNTIIASGHRWSGLWEMLALEPYGDRNIIYNFHYYDPFSFTHQGASWAGPNLQFYRNVPYPSSPESVAKILDQVTDEPAKFNLLRYGEDRWNAERIDHEIGMARHGLRGMACWSLATSSVHIDASLIPRIVRDGSLTCARLWKSTELVGLCGTMPEVSQL
jgi:hypothetical protein